MALLSLRKSVSLLLIGLAVFVAIFISLAGFVVFSQYIKIFQKNSLQADNIMMSYMVNQYLNDKQLQNISLKQLQSIVDNKVSNTKQAVILLTQKNKVFYSSDSSLIGQDFSKIPYTSRNLTSEISTKKILDEHYKILGTDYYVQARLLEPSQWKLISIIPSGEYNKPVLYLGLIIIGVTCLVVAIAVLLAHYFSQTITTPIENLTQAADLIAKGEFETRIDVHSSDEIGRLADAFRTMLSTLKASTVSRDYFDTIIHSMHNMLIVVNHAGKIILVNKATQNLLGYAEDELIGDNLEKVIAESSQQPLLQKITQQDTGSVFEKKYEKKTGQLIPVLISGSVMHDQNKRVTGIVLLAQDITELKHEQQQRENIQKQLQEAQKLEAVGKLAGGVAHDFNNILTSILGYAELLREEYRDNPQASAYVDVVINSSERAAQLIQQLLGFARKRQYHKSLVNLNTLVDETKKLLTHTIDKKITIKTDLNSQLKHVEVDSTQIEQIIVNMCLNARDAMSGQGGEILLSTKNISIEENTKFTERLAPGEYVCLSIEDNGNGMSPEVIEHIFEPFFTTKEVGHGTGLGLSMVYGIMQSHHGMVNVHSEVGVGSIFDLYFPAQQAPQIQPSQDACLPQHSSHATLAGQTILVVDDDLFIRELIDNILEPCKAKLLFATDGKQAIELYKAHHDEISLVLLDVIMPKMDGLTAYMELRKISNTVKVIFISGFAEPDKLAEYRNLGNVDFIQKPFKSSQLLAKL
jgi:PAS domain S-box-containing protein